MMATQDYYGTKRVRAWPEDRVQAFSQAGEPTNVEHGYAVQYADGYTSWSPKAVFEAAYKPVTAMDFSGALAALKAGHKVVRKCWTEWYGDELICLVVKQPDHPGEPRIGVVYADVARDDYDDNWLDWRASVSSGDLLAEDWMIIEHEITEAEGEHC